LSAEYTRVKDFFLLGKTLKSHGTAGQLRILVEDRLSSYLKPDTFIFFDLNGSKVPYQIDDVEQGQHFLISLKDINGKQESDTMTGKEIWIPMNQVKPRHLQSPRNINEKWEDYSLHDERSSNTFPILRTEEYPQQLMAVIEVGGKEILIPLHEQLITTIDRDQKIIHIEIPEGLLEL